MDIAKNNCVTSRYIKPNAHKKFGNYIKYIATREGVEKPVQKPKVSQELDREIFMNYLDSRPNSHGLFSETDAPMVLDKVAKEIANHNGALWTHVVSLKREDAERMGYTDLEHWRNLVRRNVSDMAAAHKISEDNFRWYAAFHNKETNPHVHIVVYSADGKKGFLTENGENVTVTCEPLSSGQLTDFILNCEWAENVMKNGYAGAFLDTLDNAEFKDLYCRALALVHTVSTDSIVPAAAIAAQENKAYLEIDGKGRYMESGYTYDSFYAAFCSAFTRETADIILSRYLFFYSYNGEMWFIGTSAGGNVGEIFQEYELINQTDTELEFKRISYSVAIGEPIIEYDPAKKDEYEKTEIEFRFVKTADGWRAEKFLNATDYDRSMLFA